MDALKAGGDINWQNDAMGAETMLITSIKGQKEPKVIKFLIDNGADVNIKDDTGKTALDWAHQYNIGRDRNGRAILALLEAAGGGQKGAAAEPAAKPARLPVAGSNGAQPKAPAALPDKQKPSPAGAPSAAEIKAMIERKMTVNYEHHFGGVERNEVAFEWLGPIQVIGTDVRGRIPRKCWNVKLDVKVTFTKPSSGETSWSRRGIEGDPIREMFCIWRESSGSLDFVTYQP